MSKLAALLHLPVRPLFLALSLLCFGELGFGLYLQHVVGIQPCAMCIMQRYALLVIGLFALTGGIHKRRPRIYGALIGLTALAGAGVAARQSWLQLNPPLIPGCGPGFEFLLKNLPLSESLPMLFQGQGDCSAIDWTFLGLTLANWSLINFCALIALALWLIARRLSR
jgi:disulfide bond formation protein DsbB